jgi:hypothetical protein
VLVWQSLHVGLVRTLSGLQLPEIGPGSVGLGTLLCSSLGLHFFVPFVLGNSSGSAGSSSMSCCHFCWDSFSTSDNSCFCIPGILSHPKHFMGALIPLAFWRACSMMLTAVRVWHALSMARIADVSVACCSSVQDEVGEQTKV